MADDNQRTIYTVTYEGEPLCVVSAEDEARAIVIAEGFLGYAFTPEEALNGPGDETVRDAPPEELARLAVRSPTDDERERFEDHGFQDGSEVRLAGVFLASQLLRHKH